MKKWVFLAPYRIESKDFESSWLKEFLLSKVDIIIFIFKFDWEHKEKNPKILDLKN
jgi:hypothetical protein